jgi:myo-inositol-1(or 4)-monophosphatase
MGHESSEFLNTAVTAAQRAGKIILENLGHISKNDIGLKKESDFVTRVDTESERIIINTIKEHYPEHSFLAEESAHEAETDSYRWIIDPLDGTTNYIHP